MIKDRIARFCGLCYNIAILNKWVKNMKKVISFLCVIFIGALCAAAFSGCNEASYQGAFENNLASSATVTSSENNADAQKVVDGKNNTALSLSKSGQIIRLQLSQKTSFNTLVLRENVNSFNEGGITKFRVYTILGQDKTFIYESDFVGPYRMCELKEQSAEAIEIEITCRKKVALSEVELYDMQRDSSIRVNHYHDDVSAGYFTSRLNDAVYSKTFDIITDITLFGAIKWNREGELIYVSISEEDMKKEMEALKTIIGERDVKIYLNLLTYTENGESVSSAATYSIDHHLDYLIKNIAAVVYQYDFDGVDFDWEYPENAGQWANYGKLITSLKNLISIENKKVTVALPIWGSQLNQKAKDAIDYVNVMTYDDFDAYGNHSSFGAAVRGLKFLMDKGFDKSKLCLGLPFYGRPSTGAAHWPRFRDCIIDEWTNYHPQFTYVQEWDETYPTTDAYFNSPSLIRDKTAYAMAMGIGGVMIWAGNYDVELDNPLSLYAAIAQVLNKPLVF